ncbi:hypothetical protein ABFX02_02G007600 [Erythranthe guttata]
MDRLIYSNSNSNSIPSKFYYNSPILPRFFRVRVDSPRILSPSSSSSSPATSFPLRRVSPLFCNLRDSFSVPTSSIDDCGADNSSLRMDPANVSETNYNFPKLIAQKLSRQNKVFNAAKLIVISAILLTSLHQAIIHPAFASFPSAAKAGGTSLVHNELLTGAWTGFFAGCLHTLSGPDHLAALAPLSIGRTRLESAAIGALWGCGHDFGQVIFGLLFLLLKDRLHIEVIRTWGTRVVGSTLLVIGAMGIKEASGIIQDPLLEEEAPKKKKKIGVATFATGIVHGLQPDALMMILPALALPSRMAGAAFLVMFLIGTVIAMGSYTVFIGSCSEALKERVPRITEKLTWGSSFIAIALGLAILITQFFGFSLY